jgi:hypothetical protein
MVWGTVAMNNKKGSGKNPLPEIFTAPLNRYGTPMVPN